MKNRHGLPNIIERAVANDPYNSGDCDISTTRLISPPQLVALSKKYADKIEEDVSERLWSMLGQALHVIVERAAGDDVISEQRYSAKVLGWKVSGAVDLIQGDTLYDLKCTSTWTYIYGSRIKEWTEQANINHWLYNQETGKHVTKMKNILFLRDWIASKGAREGEGGSYPPVQVVEVELDLWPLDRAEQFVQDRVMLHQLAQATAHDVDLEPCTNEERWYNERTKKFARCDSYCPVSKFCPTVNAVKTF